MSKGEASVASMILTLGAAGLVSGLTIVGIYEVTLPTITENKARELREAVFKVVPGSASLERLAWQGDTLTPEEEGTGPAIFGALDESGRLVGYAIPADGPGFQDTIRLIYGYDPARQRITGMRVLDSRETPGLGDKIIKDKVFVGSFEDLAIDPEILLVGKGKGTEDFHVEAITGATISSRAIVRILNAADETWLPRLPEGSP